ncbi:hypothetical protein CS0771_34140 [Catellatospora sp. IY07-71]|nr:hypothetical protein CS0771_34140 [Catellatospora sp. IY07-71]
MRARTAGDRPLWIILYQVDGVLSSPLPAGPAADRGEARRLRTCAGRVVVAGAAVPVSGGPPDPVVADGIGVPGRGRNVAESTMDGQ